ncbi:MAG: hypothetical protein E7035_07390 [Verrucomicrobiaceae bacterium]|nr:hypothetical protein [Verrucomicrobiaceae bacterium]
MKKIITIALSIAFAVSAFAKTQTELIAEFKALPDNKSKVAYVAENKADILKVWQANKDSTITQSDIATFKLGSDERILKDIFAKLYDKYYAEMNASDVETIYIDSGVIIYTKSQEWYDELKASNFTINGNTISERAKAHLVCRFKDVDEILKLNATTYMYNAFYIKGLQYALLNIEPEKAKDICREIEKCFILQNKEVPTQIKATSKYLTQAILDSKIIK